MFKNVYDGSKDQVIPIMVFPKVLARLIEEDDRVVYLDADLMSSFGTGNFT